MSERRLAAIMFTDIVGYTALMEKDEEQAFRLLRKNSNIQKSIIRKFEGDYIKEIGDGILASFSTNADAVRCAIAIQEEAANNGYKLRIGIHEGDLIFEKGDAWGDGVNVAARLQEIAEAGCIIISGAVYKDVKNKADIKAEFIDEKILKNVEDPVKVYQVICEEKPVEPPKIHIRTHQRRLKIPKSIYYIAILSVFIIALLIWYNLPKKSLLNLEKSIAVLPFKNLSTNPEEQYLADGMMDAIINHLQKIKELEVRSRTSVERFREPTQSLPEIAKDLNVNYIIEGSFQKVGDVANLIVQLLIAGDDRHIWAKEYTRDWSDIFSVQSEVAEAIAGELKMILTQEEKEKINVNPTKSLTAYDFYLRGKENHIRYFFSHDDQDFENAVKLFRHALSLDPEFAMAYADLSWTFWFRNIWGESSENVNYLDSALGQCNQALEVDPELSEGYTLRGLYYTFTSKTEEALADLYHATTLNPNDPRTYRFLGLLHHLNYNYEKSITNYLKAEKLEHSSYDLLILKMKMGEFYHDIGNYEKAEHYFKELMDLEPDYAGGYLWYGWLATIQGKFENAYEAYIKLYEQLPDEPHVLRKLAESLAYINRYSESEQFWEKAHDKGMETGIELIRYNHRYAYTLWMKGKREIAKQLFDEYINYWMEKTKNGSFNQRWGIFYNLAGIYSFLGNKEEALKWLRKQQEEGFTFSEPPGFSYAYENFIYYDPLFNNIRNEDEFKQIVADAQNKKTKIRERIEEIVEGGI